MSLLRDVLELPVSKGTGLTHTRSMQMNEVLLIV
jgi:hypothetical protein